MQQCTDTTPLFQEAVEIMESVGIRWDRDTGSSTTGFLFICGSKVLLAEVVACTTEYNEEG